MKAECETTTVNNTSIGLRFHTKEVRVGGSMNVIGGNKSDGLDNNVSRKEIKHPLEKI